MTRTWEDWTGHPVSSPPQACQTSQVTLCSSGPFLGLGFFVCRGEGPGDLWNPLWL